MGFSALTPSRRHLGNELHLEQPVGRRAGREGGARVHLRGARAIHGHTGTLEIEARDGWLHRRQEAVEGVPRAATA